jgi:AraC family transcriptional regulator
MVQRGVNHDARGLAPAGGTSHLLAMEPSTPSVDARSVVRDFLPELSVCTVFYPYDRGGVVLPVVPDHHLVLLTGSIVAVEKRELGTERWRRIEMVEPGDLHLVGAGGPGYEVRWQSQSHTPLELVHVHLAPALTASVAREHGADLAGREIKPHVGRDLLLERLARTLAAAVAAPRASDGAFADATAELFALHLLREHASRPLPVARARGGLPAGKLRRVQELIAAELAGTVRLAQLAAAVGLSTYHFARAFKLTTGETPHSYIGRRRIEEARRLLRETRLPIAEIAVRVGFSSQAHLTTRFREVTGVTPARFRRG